MARIAIDFDGVIVERNGIPRGEDFFRDSPVVYAKDEACWGYLYDSI